MTTDFFAWYDPTAERLPFIPDLTLPPGHWPFEAGERDAFLALVKQIDRPKIIAWLEEWGVTSIVQLHPSVRVALKAELTAMANMQ